MSSRSRAHGSSAGQQQTGHDWTTEEHMRAQLMAKEIELLRSREHGKIDVNLHLDLFAAFQLIGALQLAARHPGMSEGMRTTIEGFARKLQEPFSGPETPQMALTLEQGWHREYDR